MSVIEGNRYRIQCTYILKNLEMGTYFIIHAVIFFQFPVCDHVQSSSTWFVIAIFIKLWSAIVRETVALKGSLALVFPCMKGHLV